MKQPCVHHWLVASPDGSKLQKAVCKRCKAKRQFPAAIPDDALKKLRNYASLARHAPDFVHGRYGPG